jgi:SAM-dependent methyltransferase
LSTESTQERLVSEAAFQDERMKHALEGKAEFRDKFYFINRAANEKYDSLHRNLQGKRVVVVGSSDCGVTPLARQGVYVEGTDISPVSIEKLQQSIAEEGLTQFGSARVMDAENLEYADASLDVVTCSGVLHHIDPEKALRSWARCIKPDGAVIMFEPLAFNPFAALFRVITPSMRTPDEHPLRERDFDIMRKYYKTVERYDYGLFTPVCAAFAVIPGLRWLADKSLGFFEGLDSVVLKVLPFVRNACWLTVVRLRDPIPSKG